MGLSNTLRLLGCSHQDVAQYIGWQSGKMAEHYSRMSDTVASVVIVEEIISGAINLVRTTVSHPENLQTICDVCYFGFVTILISSSVNSRFSVRVVRLYYSAFENVGNSE